MKETARALEIARDVAKKLIEAQAQRSGGSDLAAISDLRLIFRQS